MFRKHLFFFGNSKDLFGRATGLRVDVRHFFPLFSMQKMLFPAIAAAALLSACSLGGTANTGSGATMSSASSAMDGSSSSALAASSSEMAGKANMIGITMRGGVMYTLWSDSKVQELTEDMVMSNGTVVKKDGTVVLVGGKTQMMVDGDMVTREGTMGTDDSVQMRDGADQE